jgi:hypothetical protein
MGVFSGHPRDRDWKTDVAQKAADLMEEAANGIYNHTFSGVYYGMRKDEKRKRKCKGAKATPLEEKIPRCGPIRPKTMGNSMGGGQEAPMGFFNSVLHTIVLTGLLASEPFQRIAGFTNGTLYVFLPIRF